MNGTLPPIIRHPHQKVPDINNERSRDGRSFDPLIIKIQDIQPTHIILVEKSERLNIRMATDANRVFRPVFILRRNPDRRVEVDRAIGTGERGHPVECILRLVQGKGEDTDHLPCQRETGLVVRDRGVFEIGECVEGFPEVPVAVALD